MVCGVNHYADYAYVHYVSNVAKLHVGPTYSLTAISNKLLLTGNRRAKFIILSYLYMYLHFYILV